MFRPSFTSSALGSGDTLPLQPLDSFDLHLFVLDSSLLPSPARECDWTMFL